MKNKYIILSLSLSLIYFFMSLVYLNLLGYAEAYSNNYWFPIMEFGWWPLPSFFILTVLYTIPIILLYRNRYWYFSFLCIVVFELYIIVLYVFVEKDSEYLLLLLLGNDINMGVYIGLFINFLIYSFSRLLRKRILKK